MIELITVIVITGIIAVSVAIAAGSTSTSRHHIAARAVSRDLAFARRHALATGVKTWVVFDTTTDSYSMLVEDTSNPGRAHALAFTDPATGKSFSQSLASGQLAADISTASIGSGAEVGFDWQGAPSDAAGSALASTGTVVVGGVSIAIEPGTGAISIP